MYWHEYPILRIILPFAFAIILKQYFIDFSLDFILISSLLVLLTVVLAFIIKKILNFKTRFLTGSLVNIIFFLLGISISDFHSQRYDRSGLDLKIAKAEFLIIEINDFPSITKKSVKINSKVLQIIDSNGIKHNHKAKLINYLEKDSLSKNLKFGDRLIINNNLRQVEEASNPREFDYKDYLEKKNIYYQSYLKSTAYKVLPSNDNKFSLRKISNQLRDKVLSNIQKKGVEGDEYSVAAALLLGQKDFLSHDLRDTYAGVGAMHILCVSGLHVGIIFMIIQFFLKNLDRKKHGRTIRLILILFFIWFYALITGLSPSVLRASTMFSFIAIGSNINRKIHIYNSISASALILMLFNPLIIFQLGFQLSYLAVISIVSIQPHLYNLMFVRNKFFDKIWALITVSISAQIGTFPISIFYFNQFPNYFLVTNLIVIPAAFIVIYTGLIFIFLSFIPYLSNFIADILSFELKTLNASLKFIENFPAAISNNLFLNGFQMFIIYFIIFFIGIMIIHKKRKLVFLNLGLLLLLVISFVENRYRIANNDEIIVYSTNSGLAISDFNAKEHTLYIDSISKNNFESFNFFTNNYWNYMRNSNPNIVLSATKYGSPQTIIDDRIFRIKEKTFVVYDKTLSKIKSNSSLNVDYFILNSNYLSFNDEIMALYNPKAILKNAYLSKKEQLLFEKYCNINGVKFIDLRKGYYRIINPETNYTSLL